MVTGPSPPLPPDRSSLARSCTCSCTTPVRFQNAPSLTIIQAEPFAPFTPPVTAVPLFDLLPALPFRSSTCTYSLTLRPANPVGVTEAAHEKRTKTLTNLFHVV
jgi:hypothetical protein